MVIKTGDYVIRYYNSHGSEIKQLRETEQSYAQALELARWLKDALKKSEVVSFAIERKLYDSLDVGGVYGDR